MSPRESTWNAERVDALKRCFAAGLSCGQIAREIGVTRNAVIGKMNRLGLTRPKDVLVRRLSRERLPRPPRPMRTIWSRERRASVAAQQQMLLAAFDEPSPCAEVPILNGRGCTLLELGRQECRWPISAPGADDFSFCGNAPVKGLPYCVGHARMAYRPAGRVRSA